MGAIPAQFSNRRYLDRVTVVKVQLKLIPYKELHGVNLLTPVKPALPTVPAVPVKKEFPTITSPPTVPSIPTAVTQVRSEASPETPVERTASPKEVKPCVETQGPRIKCATAQASVVFETYPPRRAGKGVS
ncbi:hypothetical protein FVEG_00274 [Fusarium verticillioides 7600]|uniref:Uncharacterized protein n=1 Tax=Gibberella moniliformis (strain M3125 / FGSC 7600) TaxID=334819 RepID=W7LL01_GIBM7|nr:hypothetical protein FVEG_00274 [Fusarium verticillioides 7600]EWG36124.1 hypothetical protein FVEG_00274 [Fusarium verticillioides 7600]